MSTIIANQRTALMFCPTLSTHSSHVWSAKTQPALKSAVKSLPRPGPACFMLVMEIKSVQCYATHASENTMDWATGQTKAQLSY